MIYTTVGSHTLRIKQDYYRHVYVGTFIYCSIMPKIYGDSVNEVLNQAEELVIDEEIIELCRNQTS